MLHIEQADKSTKNDSLGSIVLSPFTITVIVCVNAPSTVKFSILSGMSV